MERQSRPRPQVTEAAEQMSTVWNSLSLRVTVALKS